MQAHRILIVALALALAALLCGCGGGGANDAVAPGDDPPVEWDRLRWDRGTWR